MIVGHVLGFGAFPPLSSDQRVELNQARPNKKTWARQASSTNNHIIEKVVNLSALQVFAWVAEQIRVLPKDSVKPLESKPSTTKFELHLNSLNSLGIYVGSFLSVTRICRQQIESDAAVHPDTVRLYDVSLLQECNALISKAANTKFYVQQMAVEFFEV